MNDMLYLAGCLYFVGSASGFAFGALGLWQLNIAMTFVVLVVVYHYDE